MSRTYGYALGTLALITTLASTTYVVIFTVTVTKNQTGLRTLSIVTATSSLLALGCVANLTYHYGSRQRRKGMVLVVWLSTIPSLAGSILTAATLSWIEALRDKLSSTIFGCPTSTIITSGFGVFGSSLFFQLSFYALLFWALRTNTNLGHDDSDSRGSFESSQDQHSHPPPRVGGTAPMTEVSVIRSTIPMDAKKALRSSLISAVRPVTSRTKLVARDSTSLDSGSRVRMPDHDGFDSWDTSSVGPQARQAVLVSSLPDIVHFSTSGELETIPGSRPGSSLSHTTPFPDFELPLSNVPEISGSPLNQSPSISEAHIHPLFRSDSCTPPPTATPGTVVTASPLGGQVIVGSIRTLKQMRSGSLSSSSSPLAQSGCFSDSTATRRPASIEIPPPLPDFILPPSPRSLTMPASAYAKRKAFLDSTSRT